MISLPNVLTWIRVLVIPMIVWAFLFPNKPHFLLAQMLFLGAALTDWLDGYLARIWQQSTQFGAFLDPVADKLLVMTSGLLIVHHFHTWWITVPVIVIIGREITISALREWMARLGRSVKTKVLYIAKVKTAMQLISLTILLGVDKPGLFFDIGLLSLYISMILTLWSMCVYLKVVKSDLTNHKERQ